MKEEVKVETEKSIEAKADKSKKLMDKKAEIPNSKKAEGKKKNHHLEGEKKE